MHFAGCFAYYFHFYVHLFEKNAHSIDRNAHLAVENVHFNDLYAHVFEINVHSAETSVHFGRDDVHNRRRMRILPAIMSILLSGLRITVVKMHKSGTPMRILPPTCAKESKSCA